MAAKSTNSGRAGTSTEKGSGEKTRQSLKSLGKYRMEKRLGAGGMGAVYLAHDTELNRTVALKVLPKEKAESATLVQRFKAEGQAVAQLTHDNIVTIYEAGQINGFLYLALEYIQGTDVQKLINRRGPMPVKRSIEIVKAVARALQHAHERGIVHRDIKPSNLLIHRDGTVKLTDLGLARSMDESMHSGITRAGTTVGTVDYMAPEQARSSRSADIRSDIYSLGCTWYHMLTGEPPYPEGSMTNKLHAHATEPPPDPRKLKESIPEAVVAVLHRMIAKAPEERYQTPAELLEDLEHSSLQRGPVSNEVLASLAEEAAEEADIEAEAEADVSHADAEADTAEHRPRNRPEEQQPREAPQKRSRERPEKQAREKPARENQSREKRSRKKPGQKTRKKPEKRPREKRETQQQQPRKAAGGSAQQSGEFSISPEAKRNMAVGATVVGGLFLLWWISTQFASGVDGPAEVQNRNPFANNPVQQPATGGDSDDGDDNASPQEGASPDEGSSADDTSDDAGDDETQTAETDGNRESPAGSSVTGGTAADADLFKPADPAQLTIGRPGEKQHIPSWVADVPVPGDVVAEARASDVPVITVGRGSGEPARFRHLRDALDALPESGGVIRLAGEAPFVLQPTRLADRGRVVLAAAKGEAPLIFLLPDPDGRSDSVLSVGNGTLSLIGVHLVAAASDFPGDKPRSLVSVQDGHLEARNASVTLLGERDGRTAAFRVLGPSASAERTLLPRSRVLLDRTFVRGAGLTAIDVDHVALDLVAWNCLFATGAAPMLRLDNVLAGAPGPSETSRPLRTLRFLSCSAACRKTAFAFSPGVAPDQPPETQVLTVNSVFGAETRKDKPSLLTLDNWPREEGSSRERSLVRNLAWTTDTCLFRGWEILADSSTRTLMARGTSGWQRLWRASGSAPAYTSSSWPRRAISDFARLSPQRLAADTAEIPGLKTRDGRLPGCDVDRTVTPEPGRLDRATALAKRPGVIGGWKVLDSFPRTVRVDAAEEDLGEVIAANDWPDGTRFVVSGSGSRRCSAVRVRNKSLRIEFRHTQAGRPLTLLPPSRPGGSDGPPEAFLSIEGGHLEIVNGHFRLPVSTRIPGPQWFLQVTNGSFRLESCLVKGPMRSSRNYAGLVRWNRRKRDSRGTSAHEAAHHGLLVDSFLAGKGRLVSADLRQHGLLLRNCILAGIDEVFELDVRGDKAQINGAIDLANCTLSAGRSFFRVHAEGLDETATAPLHLFVEETVFARPADPESTGSLAPVLLTYTGAARKRGQIRWWGARNGYSSRMARFLGGSQEPLAGPSQQFDSTWKRAWGDEAVLRPLVKAGSVMLDKQQLPRPRDLNPDDFELHSDAPAARWSVTGEPIGARPDSVATTETADNRDGASGSSGNGGSGKATRRFGGF